MDFEGFYSFILCVASGAAVLMVDVNIARNGIDKISIQLGCSSFG